VAAAVEAVRQWRYDLYYHNGQPSGFQTEVTVRFALPKKGAR
jgi:outer membrane biosynthesis protein TonB